MELTKGNVLLISTDGVEYESMYDPQTMEWSISDLDSESGTGRNQQGTMKRSRVARKRKLSCSFPPMTNLQASNILTQVKPQSFYLEYPDAELGEKRKAKFYVGDRKAPMYKCGISTKEWLWNGIAFDFIEM